MPAAGGDPIMHLIGEIAGDVFRGWIEAIKRGCGVEVRIVEGFGDFLEDGLDEVEIAEEAVTVEGGTTDTEGDLEVVAMDYFAFALHDDRVGGTEL
jgi:hypothetical protein